MSVCYFNEMLFNKINSNAIGDNSASHIIQQVMILKHTSIILKCFGCLFVRMISTNSYLLEQLPQILTPKTITNLAAFIKIMGT
jgi:hypothetical protein